MKRNEAAKVFDVSEEERKLRGRGEKQPILPVEEAEDPSKQPAAKITSMKEFELEEQRLIAQQKSDRELVKLRARMDMFINGSGSELIDFEKPGSAPKANFEGNEEMGRIDEIFGVIEQSGLDNATVDQLFSALENLIIAVAPKDINRGKIDQIIEVIENSELEPSRKQDLILELKSMIASAMMDMDENQ